MKTIKRLLATVLLPLFDAFYSSHKRDLLGLSLVIIVGDNETDREDARRLLVQVNASANRSKAQVAKLKSWL